VSELNEEWVSENRLSCADFEGQARYRRQQKRPAGAGPL